jgi:hypothetical protein
MNQAAMRIVGFVVLASAASIAFVIWTRLDEISHSAEDFLREDPSTIAVVGAVESARVTRRRDIFATSSEPAYREYDFSVRGSKGTAFVVVRVIGRDSGSPVFSVRILDD